MKLPIQTNLFLKQQIRLTKNFQAKRPFNQKQIEFQDQCLVPKLTLTQKETVNITIYPHKSKDQNEMKVRIQFFIQPQLIWEMDAENENLNKV